MSEIKARIQNAFQGPQLSCLATIDEEGKPWVRYVMATMDDDLNIWIITAAGSRKVKHIKANPEIHMTCGASSLENTEQYLQIQARASVRTDPDLKHAMWNDHLTAYFSGPDDPDYAVLMLQPYRIEYYGMGSMTPAVWEA